MDEQEATIRRLIETWVTAVQRRDLPAVLADHAADIVMFDVPPPYDGVRGIDAYRDSWPPFFDWLASGGMFELESLQVVTDSSVAFAFGLLRCGKPEDFAHAPDVRLRLTIGLRKYEDGWVVAHEHHSFPQADTPG